MAHDVFISYSSRDKAIADAVCAALEAKRIRCWIAPRDVLPGTPYAQALSDALQGSRALVLVLSANANQSKHVIRELESAVSKGVAIVPFRIEDVRPAGSLEYYLQTIHWLDALSPPLEQHLRTLGDTVESLLSAPPGTPESDVRKVGTADPSSILEVRPADPDARRGPVGNKVSRPTAAVSDELKWGIAVGTVLVPLLGIIMGLVYMNDPSVEKQAAGKLWFYLGAGAALLQCFGCGCFAILGSLPTL